uniref:Uncharacterized protein n=1 Tax=Anguilla anguilla TaxID=7936 RepID=A0A0E9Q9I4_ANGAN
MIGIPVIQLHQSPNSIFKSGLACICPKSNCSF